MSHILFGVGANDEAFNTPMSEAAFVELLRVLPGIFSLSRDLLNLWVDVFFFG